MIEVTIPPFFPLRCSLLDDGINLRLLHFSEELGKFERHQKGTTKMLYIWVIKNWGVKLKQAGKGLSGRQVTKGM